MGNKTKIDWADSTWNPVTGCLHGCEYCYARRIAERFGSNQMPIFVEYPVLDEPVRCTDTYEFMRTAGISAGKIQPYPFDFTPTFHRYKLDEPKKWRKPRNIFVCSMADLFGDWVPDEWIQEVFKACDKAPQHTYLFLTKNPKRYTKLRELLPLHQRLPHIAELWFGTSYTGESKYYHPRTYQFCNQFISVEPLLKAPSEMDCHALAICNRWVIIGAETGNRKGKVIPEKSWIDEIVAECDKCGTPVFMKESLCGLMGNDFRQEFLWEAYHDHL